MIRTSALTRCAVATALFVLPLLAACGGDSGNHSNSTPQPTATQTSATSATAAASPTLTATHAPTATFTATQIPTPTRTATPSCPDYVDLNHVGAATFTAHGSVLQVYVMDAVAGTALDLVDEQGCVLQSGTADTAGSLIFRNVPAGSGYRVTATSGPGIVASPVLTVTTATDAPQQSFYSDQHIVAGFGYLTTRDGTQLSINVLLPAGGIDGGPYPTVIEYSGYDPSNPYSSQPSTLISAALGYAAVGINIRGTGCSGGAFDFYETLQSTDGFDAIETIAAQPWVKGHKVGMVGISYPAISQLFAAQFQPPHLAAIAPLSVIASTGSVLYPGGILNNGFATDWAAERQSDAQPYPGGQGWIRRRIEQDHDNVCLDHQKLRLQAPDIMQKIRDNPFYTDEVAAPVSPETFVHNINVPIYLAGGWQDEQTGPYFATMLDKFTGTSKRHFTVVNGNHTEPLIPAIFGRWMEFLSLYVREEIPVRSPLVPTILGVILDQAYGIKNSTLQLEPERYTGVTSYTDALAQWEAEPQVRVLFESGAGDQPGYPVPTFEASFDRWPIPGIEPAIWYFDADGKLSTSAPTGDGADSFIYDTTRAQETDFSGSTSDVWVTLPAWHWMPLTPGKAAAYVTDPLEEDVVMIGSGSVDLWVQSTAADTDLQATISEVRPDGQENYVQTGWLRASRRKLNEAVSTELRPVQTQREEDAADLPAGEFSEARVELYPFGHVFHAGSRLKVAVSAPGGDRPHWKFEALPADGEVTNTISRSEAFPSRIVLPMVPGITVPSSLPPCPALRGQPCRTYVEYENTPG